MHVPKGLKKVYFVKEISVKIIMKNKERKKTPEPKFGKRD